MLYEITVFKFLGNKKKRVHHAEIWARDPVGAVEKACIRLGQDRVVEIREKPLEMPQVKRVARDGVI